MKKIIFSFITGFALILSSCEDNFDPQIFGSMFSTNFPRTEADLESYLMVCYLPFMNGNYNTSGATQIGWNMGNQGKLRMFEHCADYMNVWMIDFFQGATGAWVKLSSADYTSCYNYSRASSNTNPNNFEKVRDITRFTEVLATLEKDGPLFLSEEKVKNYLGEIRLLRGLMLYYLMHVYGPVPVIVDPALVGNVEAEKNLVRPTLEQMTAYIYDDLDFAQQNMVETTTIRGRYTGDYAKVCLMRHCLNEGSYMTGYYDKAIEMYEALKATNRYKLYTDGGRNAYLNQFRFANKFNCEVVMAMSCSELGGSDNAIYPDWNQMTWWEIPQFASLYEDAAKTKPSIFYPQGGGYGQYINVSEKFYDTYEANDARKDGIVTEYYRDVGGVPVLKTRADIGVTNGWSGFTCYKWQVERNVQFQNQDIPLARWADVLLLYAEAVARKNKAVPTGDAMQGITDVRARAGLGPMSGDAVASYDNFMEALLIERGKELLFEGERKIDLIRFNRFSRNIQKYKRPFDASTPVVIPTHQYMPIPDYAVNQAETYGKVLTQTFERPDWELDK